MGNGNSIASAVDDNNAAEVERLLQSGALPSACGVKVCYRLSDSV